MGVDRVATGGCYVRGCSVGGLTFRCAGFKWAFEGVAGSTAVWVWGGDGVWSEITVIGWGVEMMGTIETVAVIGE